MTNRRYAKAQTATTLQYAPRTFRENGAVFVPKEDDDQAYAARGWFKVVDVKPEYDATAKTLRFTGWLEDSETMTVAAQYEIIDIPTPSTIQVRRFSKLKLVEFCMEQGIWQELKDFLEGLGYYDLFVMAVYFLENDKFFMQGLEAFKQAKAQEEGYDAETLKETIDKALAYAFDGYETVDADSIQAG